MEATLSYLLMLQKIYQFKLKDSEKKYAVCVGNISKYFTINNMKKKNPTKTKCKPF